MHERLVIGVRFDALTNLGDPVKLGYVMRWEESVAGWIPLVRFMVHDDETAVASYLF